MGGKAERSEGGWQHQQETLHGRHDTAWVGVDCHCNSTVDIIPDCERSSTN